MDGIGLPPFKCKIVNCESDHIYSSKYCSKHYKELYPVLLDSVEVRDHDTDTAPDWTKGDTDGPTDYSVPCSKEEIEARIDRAVKINREVLLKVAGPLGMKPVYASSKPPTEDLVNHPDHYTEHPSGVECITITEHMNFNLGNALKYIWRADLKGNSIQDLEKAKWYLERELTLRSPDYVKPVEERVWIEGHWEEAE